LPEDYFAVAQIPAKITANPEKTVEYLQFFEANLDKVTVPHIQRLLEP
jgi:hypothetical protein